MGPSCPGNGYSGKTPFCNPPDARELRVVVVVAYASLRNRNTGAGHWLCPLQPEEPPANIALTLIDPTCQRASQRLLACVALAKRLRFGMRSGRSMQPAGPAGDNAGLPMRAHRLGKASRASSTLNSHSLGATFGYGDKDQGSDMCHCGMRILLCLYKAVRPRHCARYFQADALIQYTLHAVQCRYSKTQLNLPMLPDKDSRCQEMFPTRTAIPRVWA